MNENLAKLKALVKETNEVISNLDKETEEIRNKNNEERLKKYNEIKEYLTECVEIAKELKAMFKIQIDIPGYKYLGDSAEVFLRLNYSKEYPINFLTTYVNHNGNSYSTDDRAFRDGVIGMDLPYRLNQHDSFNFIDNWDQDVFEKRFAAEVEKAITEKAAKANERFDSAVNSSEILGR